MKAKKYLLSGAVIALMIGGCSEKKFRIDGEVEGAADKSLVLEKSDFSGVWIAVDSVRTDKSGRFSISAASPASPEIYRISLGDKFIYLPVDSVESLTVKTTAEGFGKDFTVSGTIGAEQLASFEKELMAADLTDEEKTKDFKKQVYTKYIMKGEGSILSYYILTKIYDGKPLYNPEDKDDAKYFAAVATQFDNYRPDDPHGRMIKDVSLQAMRSRNSAMGKKTVIEAGELKVIDIDLPDASGRNVKLSDVVGRGKPVVLVFSMMNREESPAFNRELARIYNSRKGAVEIYQVSFDEGQYEWREAVANLPWINVIDPAGMSSTAARDYNVTGLPAVFLYDAGGELIDRPASLSDLEKKL